MTPELELIRDSVRHFARDLIEPISTELDHHPLTPWPERLIPGLEELGLLTLSDADSASLRVALEVLAEVSAATAAIVLANAFGRSLVASTRPEILERNGRVPAVTAYPLYAEPGVVDAAPRLTRAGGELVLEGKSEMVVNAPIAGLLVVPVSTQDGDALVAVDAESSGVGVGPALLTLGLRGAPTSDVTFSGALLRPERVLSSAPSALTRRVARRLRAPTAAISAGILSRSLATAIAYANQRYQGGKQIIEHQEVRRLIARMAEDHALCHEAARSLDSEALPEHRSLALFLRAKERAAHAACDGVQLLGGYGYMEDYPQERCMRDAKHAECLLGRIEHARQELVAALTAEARP